MSGYGYLSTEYCSSLTHIGTLRQFHNSSSCWLERSIADSSWRDGCGPYPLLCCSNWQGLEEDLRSLEGEIVSFCAVTDPFGGYDLPLLQRTFPDLLIPYKEHLITDLAHPPESFVTEHHQRDTRRALRRLEISVVEEPSKFAEEWSSLYTGLIARHHIHGPAAFPPVSLKLQLAAPGIRMFKADMNGSTVCMQLWMEDGKVAYYHLAASSAEGYAVGASYALTWEALSYYRSLGFDRVDLGAAPDVSTAAGAGLLKFKSGWATGVEKTFLVGRIMNLAAYSELGRQRSDHYFPCYRAPVGLA